MAIARLAVIGGQIIKDVYIVSADKVRLSTYARYKHDLEYWLFNLPISIRIQVQSGVTSSRSSRKNEAAVSLQLLYTIRCARVIM